MQLAQFLLLTELLLLETNAAASQFEKVKQSHLVDEFGRIIGIEKDVFPHFAAL
jgi:hypothetical protein